MSEFLDRISKLSPQRLALLADQMNERLQEAEQRRRVPLAIVGIGCRLPGGVHDPEGFWKLLSEGVDAVDEVPASRWDVEEFYDRNPDAPGKMSTRWGGFIDEPDQFDPKFFGIAPAEASSMDPQQRLLLETAWEALENAGIAPQKLAGTRSGVFLGICNADYSHLAMSSPRETITPYFASGLSHAIAAGRISYVLGLQGPSLAVDTSCSASLVAVHLACQSLRLGESDTALAGGVNIVLNQDITIALSQSKMMAPDGRCKAFSDSANGFVRGEGSGMIVLKRLPDAVRDGNRILAVIRGSACNQDGRSSGLTAPNGPSQEAVISAALADAGLTPDDIQYIEAHGTGTSLGDPIEAGALNAVFAGRKKSEPLRIGSVKSNLGHLESAAGIAGLIKLVLSLQHGKIPASLHLGKPNNRIDWEQLPLKIPTKIETWSSGEKKRTGGVSSFGFSGTNAHVIVEEYPEAIAASSPESRPRLFTLSAKTESALGRMAARLRRHLMAHPQVALADVARTLNTGRSHFEFRAAMTADSRGELFALLDGLERSDVRPQVETGRAVGRSPRVAFVFDGGAPFDAAVGREFFDAAPAFRDAFEQCEAIAKTELGLPLVSFDIASGSQDASSRNAAKFAFGYALAQLWRSCGIEPAIVAGSGVGEYVAATVAGVFELKDGLHLAILRSKGNAAGFEEFARRISYHEPQISFIGNSDGVPVTSSEYWMRRSDANGLTPAALAELAKEKAAAKLYLGRPFGDQGLTGGYSTPLKPEDGLNGAPGGSSGAPAPDGCREFLNAAAALYVLGCEPEMSGFYREAAKLVALPTYPFERERYWIDSGSRRDANRKHPADVEILPAEGATEAASEWIYDLVWEPKPLRSNAQLTAGVLDEDLIDGMAITPASAELMRIADLMAAAMPVYSTYILQAFQDAGLSPLPASAFTVEELADKMKVVPARRRVLGRLLAMLAEDGIVERAGDRFRFVDLAPRPNADTEASRLGIEYPECRTEMDVLRRCGKKLAAVLRGEYDPMQLVFADGSIDEAEHIYEKSPVCQFFNDKAGKVIRAAVDRVVERPARILEIGGGTGATTVPILSQLGGKEIEYCFTDISAAFLSRGRMKFADIASMDFRVLNIENDPVRQGFEVGNYDIVLAANVLHATADLRRTLAHIRKLLRPGGIVVLIEGVYPDRWLELTFGLTDGWWRFVDLDLRPDSPLISAEKWKRVLRDSGMSLSRTISYLEGDGSLSQQTVIVAQADADDVASKPISREPSRQWVIFADESGVGDALQNLMTAAGERCEMVRRSHSPKEMDSVFRKLEARTDQVGLEVVYLWGIDIADLVGSLLALQEGAAICSTTLIHLAQTLLSRGKESAHLSIVTRGAQATETFSPTAGGAVQSLAWGVGRVFGLEAPQKYRAIIDLDPAITAAAAAAKIFAELLGVNQDDQVAYRGGKRLVPRLRHSSLRNSTESASQQSQLRGTGSYLLVGGLGGVGLKLARWAAGQRPGHLVLLSRTGLGRNAGGFAQERATAIREIEELGVDVTVVEGDVASAADMKRLMARFGGELPPLRGIFHAATMISGAEIPDLTDAQIETMLHAKVQGTWVLHDLTRTLPLDFFIVFSSTASVLGAKGMADYAAANQFLDAFAHTRRAAGLPMLSVNWGSWDVLRKVSEKDRTLLGESGILPMQSEKLFGLFSDLMASPRAQVTIANIDWDILKPLFELQRTRPLLEHLGTGRAKVRKTDAVSAPMAGSLHAAVGMTPAEQTKFIEAFVLEQAAKVLGFRGGELPPVDVPLQDIGLDSLMAVDLKNRLQTALGQELSATIVFDYPTVSGIVAMLETMLWAAHGGVADEVASAEKDVISI